jgi:hypothetical protein
MQFLYLCMVCWRRYYMTLYCRMLLSTVLYEYDVIRWLMTAFSWYPNYNLGYADLSVAPPSNCTDCLMEKRIKDKLRWPRNTPVQKSLSVCITCAKNHTDNNFNKKQIVIKVTFFIAPSLRQLKRKFCRKYSLYDVSTPQWTAGDWFPGRPFICSAQRVKYVMVQNGVGRTLKPSKCLFRGEIQRKP